MGDEEYEVEAIRDYRIHRGKEQFFVKWKGYKEEENSWENVSNLFCDILIKKYRKENKDKIEKINSQSKPTKEENKRNKEKFTKIQKRISKAVVKDDSIKYIFEQGSEKYSKMSNQVNNVELHLIISYLESNCVFPPIEDF